MPPPPPPGGTRPPLSSTLRHESQSPSGPGRARVQSRGVPMDRYIVVSADGHAGLKCEDYRPYLEAKYYPQFDQFLAEREARRAEHLRLNYDYIMSWETQNEEGLKGAYDAARRDKQLDSAGVAA